MGSLEEIGVLSLLISFFDRLYMLKKLSWHEQLSSSCSRLHLAAVARIVDVMLFKNTSIWEPGVSKFLVKTSGKLFVDVGACYGRYVILLSRKYKQLIAIEPIPSNVHFIMANLRYAHLRNVKVLQCAVSDDDGNAYLHLREGRRADQHQTLCSFGIERKKLRVKTLTLETILQHRCADLVKVDVEGAEWRVLKGAEPIADMVKRWVVELHSEQRKQLEEWFISHGYSTRWLDHKHIYAVKNL